MGTLALPPGFRFHPTDEELISCYLKGKLNHGLKEAELEVITEVDLYRNEPWDLPEKSFLPSRDMEWYFYSPRDRKYPMVHALIGLLKLGIGRPQEGIVKFTLEQVQ